MTREAGKVAGKDPLLAALREEIGQPTAVRPAHPGRPLIWGVTLFTAIMALILLWILGLRSDRPLLGDLWMWGLTLAQLLVTVPLWWLAVRESLPSRRPGLGGIAGISATALAIHWVVAFLTHQHSPTSVPPEMTFQTGVVCLSLELLLGVPLVAGVFIFLRRYLAPEPWRCSLASGVAAGVLGDGLWRLFCPFSDASHILTSHTPGIVLVSLAGLGLAALGLGRR